MRTDYWYPSNLASWVRNSRLLQIASVALGCLVCAKFASSYALANTGAVVLWLPNAVVLSALLLTPWRQWWKFSLTQFVCELLVSAEPYGLLASMGFGVANVLEVLLAAWLIRRTCGRAFAFSNVREVALFVAIAMGLAPACAALLGTWMHYNADIEPLSFGAHWQVWWVGDGMGMVLLTPLLFGWLHRPHQKPHRADTSWPERAAFVGVLIGLLQQLFFFSPEPSSPVGSPLLLLPLVLWAAVRFGTRGVSMLGCVVCVFAIVQTFEGRGLFSQLDASLKVPVLQQYLAALSLTGLAVATIVNDLAQKYRSLGLYKQELELAQDSLSLLNREIESRVAQRTAELERLATTDPLTDTHNRRFLMARAQIEIALAKRQSHAVSMVMFDIDHFKHVNDSHGHNVGDRVLVALCQAVRQEMRLGDTFARVGGEEFVMLLPRSDAAQAQRVAERLRALIEALEIHAGCELVLHITASFGVATMDAKINTVDALYEAADTALYQAKDTGRNCVVVHQRLEPHTQWVSLGA